ncbi:ABC transporter ATP-binding protein [Gephyromycinifex aptenodytis]|uniref:ABC transporter ATP-binding protein n=1 Tax=Gephyromycinifex aptenodytis TaxID=2716227 RepID=UPI00144722D1|nr:ABC transporter ATP-binding protein [Gephyromycinifex aptenodytis]
MLRAIHVISGGGRPFWGFLGAVLVSATLQAGAVLTLYPLLARLFGPNPASAGWWVLVLIGLVAVAWVMDVLAARLGLQLGIGVMRAIHQHAPQAVLSWPASKLTPARASRLRSLVSGRATEATSAVILIVGPVITAVALLFALSFGLVWISPLLAVVTLVGGLLCLAAMWGAMRLQARATSTFTRANEELDDRLFEFAWAQPSLRTARRVADGRARVDSAIEATRCRMRGLLVWQLPGEVLFSLALQVVLLGFGVVIWRSYDAGSLSAAGAAASVVVLLRVVEQATMLSSSADALDSTRRTLAEVREIVETTAIVPSAPSPDAPQVRLRDVGVQFADGLNALSNVDLDLAPGTVTVVVGPSGSGKSTLLRVLAGLTEPTCGEVELDGVPASAADLRGNAAVVFQDSLLHAGTVRENLRAVNPGLTAGDQDRIARLSGLDRVLEALPHGWDTPVGELGGKVSGGERQRVGVARALAKSARLLLVDEATSALDNRNERTVVDALAQIRPEYTTVVVAHRPAMLDIADNVIVLDGGRIVETGTVSQLKAAGGVFALMTARWRESAQWRL